jgi:polyisoprenoid-binding protein YceI
MENTTTVTKTKWVIDPAHSELTFRIRHLMITNVKGEFQNFNVSVESNETDFSTAKFSSQSMSTPSSPIALTGTHI